MTDITELAQSLKAAAEKATPGEWVYFPKNTSIEYDVGSDESQGSILYVDSGDFTQAQTDRNGEFIALANPANILALVEVLEKAQAKADVYDMLRDDYGLREKGVGLADFVDWQAKCIAELESRTVTAGNLQESAYRAGLTAGWNLGLANNNDGFNKCLAAHAAGIKVEDE
ncbi:RelE family toxin-antitoxin system [Klebsiella pneumoniae]|uniref:ead/Ea22-like family protein n=1 Tax=Klebsiella pneumoniae TaxID=573 RepID=UPI000E2B3C23|nr:ead/Ea22-like family protein [Klebsiella pneumoniae]SVZ66184.1 RelE family toxin-antitoxin system [Klebsiella pneumoniae]SVZ95739.1 RelE family toxin-antitoxin system [Klebsiella pneumoniae]SWA17686.1 RelE family toxin-antitoxin system [Klebsiella pneumoniae]HDY6707825.1 ead/Ea22-like family protein [Klebsiella pneumoniae]